MDVTGQTFYYHLPRIIHGLANCSFVSLDLELSGIHTNTGDNRGNGTQTLQERYVEVKAAAEKYQILQIGLTIANEDLKTGSYTLKPYNLHLNPIIDNRLDVERTWSYQSSAVEFLLQNNFRMQAPYEEGVQYLSRDEEKTAMAKAVERNQEVVRSNIDIAASDHESLKFLADTRRMIDAWLDQGEVGNLFLPRVPITHSDLQAAENYLNIPPPRYQSEIQSPQGLFTILNRFQKRLIHQLIETEYPTLVSIGKPTFVQILPYDDARETAVKRNRIKNMEERILKCRGFRWIVEALSGGNLSEMDPSYFASLKESLKIVGTKNQSKEFADSLKHQLKAKRPVLVGHNLFTDLVNFCKCFFGALPERVEDFQDMVHERFPMLIDTKYMATHNCGSINPKSSLSDINNELLRRKKPNIVIDPLHHKYDGQELWHEAGYDSLLTAQVFIKLSAQQRDGCTFSAIKEVNTAMDSSNHGQHVTEEGQKVQTTSSLESMSNKVRPAFGHSTKFDVLADLSEATELDPCHSAKTESSGEIRLSLEDQRAIEKKTQEGELIPRFGSEFWKVYANKLRIFGTEERVCILGKIEN